MQQMMEKFKTVETKLKAQPWFKKGKWITSMHEFPSAKPEGITFHVSKKYWFNENKQGIHFESYLSLDQKKQKNSYVTLHLLHEPLIPGTKLKRTEISKPVVDTIRDKVNSWDGYTFRAGAYGVQPFVKKLDGTSKDFEKVLELEISRLCRSLGDVIDEAIKAINLY